MKINSENLKAIRVKKGIGQVELAEKAESTQSMISQLENGCRGCHPQLAEKIASVLECGVEEITGEPSMWVQFMRNCKLLSYEQMQSINGVVIQMIKGSANFNINQQMHGGSGQGFCPSPKLPEEPATSPC